MKWLNYGLAITIGASMVAIGTVYHDKIFPAFVTAWLILIPIASIAYLMYGLREYIKERKNSIVISIKPNNITERLMELIRKEEEIKIAKDAIYKEMKNGNGKYKFRGEI